MKPDLDFYKSKVGLIRNEKVEKLDNPELHIFYCRSFTFKKTRVKYISIKLKKVRYATHYLKKFCLARMKIVPAHTRDGKFYNYYAYCPKHNMKINLGY